MRAFCSQDGAPRHDGSLSTGHANSSADMLSRLETLVLMGMDIPLEAIRQQIVSAVDIVIHLGRLRDRSRRVLEICEVGELKQGNIQLHALYRFVEQGEQGGRVLGELQATGRELLRKEKCEKAGIKI